ncbi:DUF2970 domain-containing protein [Deefgea sp. CFH1-16]|uniref:DUF2970 domain-containing protein n=1 Tax=Deefgea sp. CFH1-16 TaxID=2675457 RepID=UPI0015F589FB|nr:DUF2970 domain-containing protein [Deefgea sp. CFH1-16]MBM5574120.1 DUF2970 domain-containing protein [Deefgea sp. CFH1-16]
MKTLWATILAVLAGFFGVRSRKNAERAPLKLPYLIAAGVLCALLLAALLLALARYLVSGGGA